MNIILFLQIIGTLFGLIALMFGFIENRLLIGGAGIILLALVVSSIA